MAKKPTKKEVILDLSDAILEVAVQEENDHAKEEKVSIKQGDVTKCGFTVRMVLPDGRLSLASQSMLKVVDRDDVQF